MISRRSIRIKVLQALYSQLLVNENKENSAKEIYQKSIEEVLLTNLIYIRYIENSLLYLDEYARQQKEKYLIKEEERAVNLSILNGQFISFLKGNQEYQKLIKKNKIDDFIQSEFVRSLFVQFQTLKEYSNFLRLPNNENEILFLQAYIKKFVFSNEDIKSYLESYFANIDEDSDLVHFSLRRAFKTSLESNKFYFSLGYTEMKTLYPFADELISKTLQHQDEYMTWIEPKLIGWEIDRIPILDLLLIKIALSEMLYFESIPLKVTVNEYIDLSKIFCSVKSKDFVNGIMDRIMKQLQEEGKITKTGRGLK